MEFQCLARQGIMPLDWINPEGSVALFSWGVTDAWDELSGPEWLAHLVGTLDPKSEPVAGIPGPAAHMIAGLRLTAAEYWRSGIQSERLSVEGAAVYNDSGRLYVVTVGNCRLFRARGRHEIFLTEPAYSGSGTSSDADTSASGEVMEQILWAQDLPRPGDVYLLAVGVESEPPQGLKDFLLEAAGDPARALQYCRGVLFAGIPAAADAQQTPYARRTSTGPAHRASEAIIQQRMGPAAAEPAPAFSNVHVPPIPQGAEPAPDPLRDFPLPAAIAPASPAASPPSVSASPASTSPSAAPAPASPPEFIQASRKALEETELETSPPSIEPRTLGWKRWAGIAVLLLVMGAVALMSLDHSGALFRHAPWADGMLSVASDPTGAHVTVDGKDIGSSPLQMHLPAGKHLVEARLGDLGVDRMTFDLKSGDEARYHPRFTGQVSLLTEHPGLPVYAQIDGSTADSIPVVWKDVTAGRHLVTFSGPGVLPFTAEVKVISGQVTTYTANPQPTTDLGEVQVSSIIMTDQGGHEGKGDAVLVDARLAGRTPLKLKLDAGTHSVRVNHNGFDPQLQLLELKAGQTKYVKAEFDGIARAHVEVNPPFGSPSVPLIAATFQPGHGETLHELRLYYCAPGDPVFVRRVMTLLDPGRKVYAAPLPPLDDAHPTWRYYVLAVDSEFNEVPSEILTYGAGGTGSRHLADRRP